MDSDVVSYKVLSGVGIVSLLLIIVLFAFTKGRYTSVVFCDIGQGDGIYIRTKQGQDILIDAGPTKDILLCLGKYMPFYDHTIEYAILSHAHIDHYGGFQEVVSRYKIELFLYSLIPRKDQNFNFLISELRKKQVKLLQINSTDVLNIDREAKIKFIWPFKDVLKTFNEEKDDLNDTSLVGIFSDYYFDILFTGDISPDSIKAMLKSENVLGQNSLEHIELLKVPHHGSKNGLTPDLLDIVNPYLSIASVGIRNKFGHPSPEIVELFRKTKRTFLTTALNGTIEIRIFPNKWFMKIDQP
jgi:competence protein ComEC